MTTRDTKTRLAFIALSLLAATVYARADDDAPPASAAAPATGLIQAKITERSRDSGVPLIIQRMGWGTMADVKRAKSEEEYDLSGETFEVYVPPGYTGEEPYGLFVWVSSGDDGKPPEKWLDVLAKHKLIWVGANRSGNNRAGWVRIGLALDAARHVRSAYKIDKDRVYVAGGSGGGRVSSMMGIAYPEIFSGGFYMIGCNFYRPVLFAEGKYYRRNFARPSPHLFRMAQQTRRHVFLTGDDDPNRDQTKAYFEAAKKDGFRHATYIQVPGLGHDLPDADGFEQGILALDAANNGAAGAAATTSGAAAEVPKDATTGAAPKSQPPPPRQSRPALRAGRAPSAPGLTSTTTSRPRGNPSPTKC